MVFEGKHSRLMDRMFLAIIASSLLVIVAAISLVAFYRDDRSASLRRHPPGHRLDGTKAGASCRAVGPGCRHSSVNALLWVPLHLTRSAARINESIVSWLSALRIHLGEGCLGCAPCIALCGHFHAPTRDCVAALHGPLCAPRLTAGSERFALKAITVRRTRTPPGSPRPTRLPRRPDSRS